MGNQLLHMHLQREVVMHRQEHVLMATYMARINIVIVKIIRIIDVHYHDDEV